MIRFDFDERHVFDRAEPALPWVLRVLIADAAFWVLFAFFLGPWIALIYLLWPRPVAPQQVAEDHTPIVFLQPQEIPPSVLRRPPTVKAPPAEKPPDHILLPGNQKPFEAGDPPAPQPSKAPEPPQPEQPKAEPESQIARNTVAAPPVGQGRDDSPRPPVAGVIGRALQKLDRYAQTQSPANPLGSGDPNAAGFQFDPKGVDFGPWLRRFKAQVERNWDIPLTAQTFRGRVVLQFVVHRDGRITDLRVVRPSDIESFTRSSFNALALSNPTLPLPTEFPDEACPITVTFFYNERPD